MSSPGEFHPQALSEPYVRLSPHTAPSVQSSRPLDDLALVQGSSSEKLARVELKQDHQRPFSPVPLQNLQPYYERFCPCAPHRYSGTCGVLHLRRSLRIGTTGSPVPHRSLIRVLAVCMPGASGAQRRSRVWEPPPHPAAITTPRFRHHLGHFDTSSTVHLRSTPRISPDAVIAAPFPATLTTRTLYPSSSWRFDACACTPTSEGPPPSSTKHPTLPYSPFSSNVSSGHTMTPNPSIERTRSGGAGLAFISF